MYTKQSMPKLKVSSISKSAAFERPSMEEQLAKAQERLMAAEAQKMGAIKQHLQVVK